MVSSMGVLRLGGGRTGRRGGSFRRRPFKGGTAAAGHGVRDPSPRIPHAMRLPFLLLPLAVAAAAPVGAQVPDGPITRAQVEAAARRQFNRMDANRDGAVTRAEFDAYRARTADAPAGDPFGHVGGHWFERADANNNGRVTLEEASARPLQLFDMADLNHDGTVDGSERRMAEMLMGVGKR